MSNVDDSTIDNEANLWRRICPDHFVYDPKLNKKRPSSAAFRDEELSVHLEEIVVKAGQATADILRAYPSYGLASFKAGDARKCPIAQIIVKDPTETDPSHTLVIGRKTKAVQKALVTCSQMLVEPHS